MKVQQICVARVMRMTAFGLFMLVVGMISFVGKVHAEQDVFAQVVGQVIGNVVVAGMDGVSCAAQASINQVGRGRDGYRGQRASDYTQCANQANMQRQMIAQQQRAMQQQAYYQRQAMAQREYHQQQTEAPRCQYYERNGRQYRTCDETVRGPWR